MQPTWVPAAVAVARRPRSWVAAVRQARTLVPERWWSRPPYLPVPDRHWMAFRMTTAYGSPGGEAPTGSAGSDDVATFLAWADGYRRAATSGQVR